MLANWRGKILKKYQCFIICGPKPPSHSALGGMGGVAGTLGMLGPRSWGQSHGLREKKVPFGVLWSPIRGPVSSVSLGRSNLSSCCCTDR